ncbi:MAG: hypothetical protein ACR2HE_11560 [Casimicrobiaceae bacterium]
MLLQGRTTARGASVLRYCARPPFALFVAGDIVSGLNQISVTMGHAAIAATTIHNRLRGAA